MQLCVWAVLIPLHLPATRFSLQLFPFPFFPTLSSSLSCADVYEAVQVWHTAIKQISLNRLHSQGLQSLCSFTFSLFAPSLSSLLLLPCTPSFPLPCSHALLLLSLTCSCFLPPSSSHFLPFLIFTSSSLSSSSFFPFPNLCSQDLGL